MTGWHPEMLFDLEELERSASLPGRLTAVIPSAQAPLPMLVWSLVSLLCRTPPDFLHHVIVVLNGPHSDDISARLQDEKQEFLEELRRLTWHGRPLPLSILRAHGHVGHAQAIEMALPWVATEHYLLMHDDVMVLDPGWTDELEQRYLKRPDVALATVGPHVAGSLTAVQYNGRWKLGLPHLQTAFVVANKPILHGLGCRWWGHHIERDFRPRDLPDPEAFLQYHAERNQLSANRTPDLDRSYGYFNVDIGGWVYYRLQQAGHHIANLSDTLIHHFVASSWNRPESRAERVHRASEWIDELFLATEGTPGAEELAPLLRRWTGDYRARFACPQRRCFLVGSGDVETALLGQLLNAHPQLSCLPAPDSYSALQDGVEAEEENPAIAGYEIPDWTELIVDYQQIRELVGPHPVLFLLRDVRDVVAALRLTGRLQPMAERMQVWLGDAARRLKTDHAAEMRAHRDDPLALAAVCWKYKVSTLFLLQQQRRQVLAVRYEDLLRSPEPQLRRILKFLKLAWHAGVLRHDLLALSVNPPESTDVSRCIGAPGLWQSVLSPTDAETVLAIAGDLNDRVGQLDLTETGAEPC